MRPVDPRETNEMKRLLALMEGKPLPPAETSSVPHRMAPSAPTPFVPDAPGVPSGAAINDMKTILMAMQGAVEGVARAGAPKASQPNQSRVVVDRMLAEALGTEAIPGGSRVGAWEIRGTSHGKQKLYDVVSVNEGTMIARELTLYEAALGLVRVLNDGGVVNSAEALEILAAERDYANALHDAVLFARRLKESPKSPRRPILEDRYGDAKRRAVHARNRVMKQVGDID